MPRHKRSHALASANRPAGFLQAGLAAFRRNDFIGAIAAWQKLNLETAPEVRGALAEAYFRRALAARDDQTRLADLQAARDLVPTEPRYWYHAGLVYHRLTDLDQAQAAYARAAELGFPRRDALAFARGLAGIEADPALDLETVDWLLPEDRAALYPLVALRRNQPQLIVDGQPGGWLDRLKATFKDKASAQLWRGLAFFGAGDMAQALATLAAISPAALPPEAEATRALYHGWTLVNTGNPAAAMPIWLRALQRAPTPGLEEAVAAAGLRQARANLEAGNAAGALQAARPALDAAPGHPGVRLAAAIAHHRLAEAAMAQQQWAEAVGHWNQMADLLDLKPLVSWRLPVLRNLAILHEQLEQWDPAADAWAALLGALPKREPKAKKGKAASGVAAPVPAPVPALDEQRRWLRRRILDNFERAGRPDQAIVYYKQGVKANPDDLDLRLELVGALLANQQELAARNELKRILERDPQHLDARVRLAEVQQLRGEGWLAEQSLREVLAQAPEFEPARRGLLELLRDKGQGLSEVGHLVPARQALTEALMLAPGDADVLTGLGFVEWQLDDEPTARAHFEAALAQNEPKACLDVFECWAGLDQFEEARRVLAQAEQALTLSPHFYVDAAGACFHQTGPDRFESPAALFGAPLTRPDQARAQRWELLGRELLAKAIAGGDQEDVLRHIVSEITPVQPALALEYAQKLVKLAPDDPQILIMLAFLQMMAGQTKPAKETLRQAAHLARKAGDSARLAEIEELRQAVNDPLFGLLGPMLPGLLGALGEKGEEFFL